MAWACGSRVDCDLGLTLAHGGGYPGYGSYLLLLPEHGIGIFAFANRTYAGPSPPVWQAALELHRAGLLPAARRCRSATRWPPTIAPPARCTRRATSRPGRGRLAMNFLMDRSAENWAREFARLKAQTGDCRDRRADHRHRRAVRPFAWTCERGRLQGQLLLAPTNPPTIQALRLRVVP